jgi:hypothetical protein
MMFHPSAADLFAPGRFETVAKVITAVHALGLLSTPIIFLGTLGLSKRLAALIGHRRTGYRSLPLSFMASAWPRS